MSDPVAIITDPKTKRLKRYVQIVDSVNKSHVLFRFETRTNSWMNGPVLVLTSIFSKFSEKDLQMTALMSIVTSFTNKANHQVSVLLADAAHCNAESLQFGRDVDAAYQHASAAATILRSRFTDQFRDYLVKNCHDLVNDPTYSQEKAKLQTLSESEPEFLACLNQDMDDFLQNHPDIIQEGVSKEEYVKLSIQDILCQCVILILLSYRGIRYVIYPGKPSRAGEFICKHLQLDISFVTAQLYLTEGNIVECDHHMQVGQYSVCIAEQVERLFV